MTTKQSKSRILDEMHETAEGLYQAGLIDKHRMREFNALAKLNVEPLSSEQIRSLREKLRISQAVLAAVLNTSVSTVQKWEIGDKKPSGPSLRLLHLLDRKGLEAVI